MSFLDFIAPAGGGGGTDPNFGNVILLIGANGSDGSTSLVDESSYANTINVTGDAQIDTAQSKFGGSSLLLDGSGDYISLADNALWDFGSGDFTVELWALPNGQGPFIGQDTVFASNSGWRFAWNLNNLNFRAWVGGSSFALNASWTGPTGQWYHVAADRSGNTWRIYRDGVMVASGTNSGSIDGSGAPMNIGTTYGSTYSGWMDEIRLTKGVARYASDAGFTPPTAAFPRS